MSDTLRRSFAIISAILIAYVVLQLLRSLAITAEARGICAGVAGCMVGELIAPLRRRRKR